MSFSQNVRFRGTVPADREYPHPPGRRLALDLEEVVRSGGWTVREIDNWRDNGWALRCGRDSALAEIAFAEIKPEEWMLQVAPTSSPGLIERLRGRTRSATRNDLFDLAALLHTFLRTEFSDPRWCRDGFPDDEAWTPEPMPWIEAG